MLPAQLHSKANFVLPKTFLALAVIISLFAFLPGKVHASWTYDKDQPTVYVTADCDSDGSIELDSRYPSTDPAYPTSFGTCAADNADIYINCYDSPTVGGSGCKYITFKTSKANGIQTAGSFGSGTALGPPAQNTNSAAVSTKMHMTASAQQPTVVFENDGSALCAWDVAGGGAPQNYTCAVDWAGNIAHFTNSLNTIVFATCTIAASPTSIDVEEGYSPAILQGTLTYTGPSSKFSYAATSSNSSIITVDSTTGSLPNYSSNMTAVSRGTASIHMAGKVNNKEVCYRDVPVTVRAVGPWWQVTDNDIYANGTLSSVIPNLASPKTFDLDGSGGYPGIPNYNSTTAPNWGASGGTVSSKSWIANSAYTGRTYNYDWFLNQTGVPTDQVTTNAASVISGPTADNTTLNTGYSYQGAYYRYRGGDLTINGNVDVGSNKVVLFVSGNLTINGNVNLTDGTGFFAAIVGGNIIVNGTVTNGANPALEGFYLANGTFNTGSSNNRLVTRGAVAGLSGVTLSRDLLSSNTNTPAELFQYAPDLVLSMPYALMRQGLQWSEINP